MAAIELTPSASPRSVGGEGVGEDRARVGEDQRAAHALPDAHQDQPERRRLTVHPRDREQDREGGEDGEAEVEHPHPAVDVSEPAEADEKHRHHHHEAEDQPEQIARVARRKRVDPDAAKDVGQCDEQDRGVDRRHQHPERRVRQRDPLVVELV
jgi:hypothetical protein